jgi:hypothetical protein
MRSLPQGQFLRGMRGGSGNSLAMRHRSMLSVSIGSPTRLPSPVASAGYRSSGRRTIDPPTACVHGTDFEFDSRLSLPRPAAMCGSRRRAVWASARASENQPGNTGSECLGRSFRLAAIRTATPVFELSLAPFSPVRWGLAEHRRLRGAAGGDRVRRRIRRLPAGCEIVAPGIGVRVPKKKKWCQGQFLAKRLQVEDGASP